MMFCSFSGEFWPFWALLRYLLGIFCLNCFLGFFLANPSNGEAFLLKVFSLLFLWKF